eukprot:scaffold159588_cov26-Tisochrysis_lutea.AAC.1
MQTLRPPASEVTCARRPSTWMCGMAPLCCRLALLGCPLQPCSGERARRCDCHMFAVDSPWEGVGNASTVKEYLTVDVIETRLTSIDAAPSADSAALTPPIVKGQLKLVLARLTAATRRSPAGGPRPDFAANDAVVSSRPDGRRRASATVRSGDGARHK